MRYKEPRGRKADKVIYVVEMYFFSLPHFLFYNEDKLNNLWWERGQTFDVPMHPGFLVGWGAELDFSSGIFH